MRHNIFQNLALGGTVVALGGCSFLSASPTDSSTTSDSPTLNSITTRPSSSASLSSGSAATATSSTQTSSTQSTGPLPSGGATSSSPGNPMDPTVFGSPSASPTLADPTAGTATAAANALPMSIKDKQPHVANLPRGVRSLRLSATCTPESPLSVEITFNSRTSPGVLRHTLTPCRPQDAVGLSLDSLPADASQVTVKASATDQLWLVVQAQ